MRLFQSTHWTRSSANISHLWWPSIEIHWDPIWWFNLESNIGASATSVKGKRKMVAMWTDIPMRFFVSSSSPRGGQWEYGRTMIHTVYNLQLIQKVVVGLIILLLVVYTFYRLLHVWLHTLNFSEVKGLGGWDNSRLISIIVFSLLHWCQKRM